MRRRRDPEAGGAGTEQLYGRQPVLETLRAGRRRVTRLSVMASARPVHGLEEILGLASSRGVPVVRVEHRVFSQLGGDVNHQGVLADVGRYPYVTLDELLPGAGEGESEPFVLILDHLQDPQNLGSILRTAEAAGVDGVVVPTDRAVPVTPAVVRASAGAAEHVRIARETNLVRAMKKLQEAGLWLTGFEAVPEAGLYGDGNYTGPVGLVIGSEGRGLGRLVRETCDYLVRLPQCGRVTSLNAGAAAAIAMYEVRRQRDQKAP